MVFTLVLPVAVLSTTVYDEIVNADYENGDVTSGIAGLTGTHAQASDAAFIANFGRLSNHAICHKALLNDDSYFSSGKSRSESDTLAITETRYVSGTEFIYRFSLLLADWQDWQDTGIPTDIVWQFKHTGGGPDAMLGIKRNSLVLRYGESGAQANIVADVTPFDNEWIDIEVHILWRDTDTGFIRVSAQTPNDAELKEVFFLDDTKTFTDNGSGDFGYLKWGLYRPDSTENNNYNERVACHDNVQIIRVSDTTETGNLQPMLPRQIAPTATVATTSSALLAMGCIIALMLACIAGLLCFAVCIRPLMAASDKPGSYGKVNIAVDDEEI